MKKPMLRIDDKRRVAIKSDGTEIEVKDSKESVYIQPNQEDIKNGIPGDHANCMYCLACKRMYGSELVWVTRMLAYVELKKRGKSQLHRFVLRQAAKRNIENFDAGNDVPEEAVIFAAPSGSLTLDAQAEKYHQRKKAYVSGKIKDKGKGIMTKTASSGRKKPDHISTLRDPATGKFHFHKT